VSGPDDVTVVWVEKAEGRDDALRALRDWGRARGLKVVIPADGPSGSAVKIDFAIADRVEKELDRAREAIAALDADVAERALARADAILREHPELPQAAWLRAEVHRSFAARWTRVEPRDDVRAQNAWQDADALDGGRAAGIGELAVPPRPKASAALTVQGGGSRAIVARLDGVELTGTSTEGTLTYAVDVPPAEHHLVISVDGETAFAAWVAIAGVPAGSPKPSIPVRIGDDGACAASSFAGVVRDGNGVRAANVSCDRWVAAAPAERRGTVLVARCERSTCGPFLEWRSEGSFGLGPETPVVPRGGAWPGWATWTAVGVGAVAATTITLIATGVFESRPTEPRFIAGGVRTE
jgi:hypothetical protein